MKVIEEVIAFKTPDGKLFENRMEASKHDVTLTFNAKLEEYVKENFYSSMNVDEIASTIKDTAEYLHSILSLIMPTDEDYND